MTGVGRGMKEYKNWPGEALPWDVMASDGTERSFSDGYGYTTPCMHEGCDRRMTVYPGIPGHATPRKWCREHGTAAWAMRRKRAWEKVNGVKQLES